MVSRDSSTGKLDGYHLESTGVYHCLKGRMNNMIEQTKVHFDSQGVGLVGYLYRLTEHNGVQPGVVLATGCTGTQDTPSIRAAAHEFATAGFATQMPRCLPISQHEAVIAVKVS